MQDMLTIVARLMTLRMSKAEAPMTTYGTSAALARPAMNFVKAAACLPIARVPAVAMCNGCPGRSEGSLVEFVWCSGLSQ